MRPVRTPRRWAPVDEPERQREVFAAALQVLAEVGYVRFNMDLVAGRAKAGKASLYQRWPSKARLIMDALHAVRPTAEQPDLGSFVEDVRTVMRSWDAERLPGGCPDMRGIFLGLLEGARHDEELARLRTEQLTDTYEQPLRVALSRAVDRGEVSEDVDPTLLVKTLVWNYVLHPGGAELSSMEVVDQIVDRLLAPLLAS